MQAPAAPVLLLDALTVRFRTAHDPLGWHILIGDDAMVRPNAHGYIKHWMHAPGTNPEAFRRDVDLLKAVIAALCKIPGERGKLFRHPHSDIRRNALEEVCDIANEVVQEGPDSVADWIGRDH